MTETPPNIQPTYSSGKTAAAGGRQYPLASWPVRVAATLIDGLTLIPFYFVIGIGAVLLGIGTPTSEGSSANGPLVAVGILIMVLGYVGAFAFSIWQLHRQGKTGSTIGKKAMGIAVIKERDAQVTGFWLALGRSLLHFLDGILYIGYLWPLWDAKSQTFADKIVETVVIRFK